MSGDGVGVPGCSNVDALPRCFSTTLEFLLFVALRLLAL